MLPRIFILLVVFGTAAYFAFQFFQAQRSDVRLKGSEFKALKSKSGQVGREAAKLRDQIHKVTDDDSLKDDVDRVLRGLAERQRLRGALEDTAQELRSDDLEKELAELELAIESARSPSDEANAKKRYEQCERQNALADDLQKRIDNLDDAQAQLLIELRDVHLAVLEHRTKSTEAQDLASVRERLLGAGQHMRLQAEALDEVQHMLESTERR